MFIKITKDKQIEKKKNLPCSNSNIIFAVIKARLGWFQNLATQKKAIAFKSSQSFSKKDIF